MIGDPNMPFTNSLAQHYGQATDYYGVTHTSEPNYIAATSGSNWDVNNDNGWNPTATSTAVNHYDHTNIVDELESAHIRWAAYMDGMPSVGYLGDAWPTKGVRCTPASTTRSCCTTMCAPTQPAGRHQALHLARARPQPARRASLRVDQSRPVQRHARWGLHRDRRASRDTLPLQRRGRRRQRRGVEGQGRRFPAHGRHTITHSRAWTPNSVIFVTADETDYDGSNASDNFYAQPPGAATRRRCRPETPR